MNRLPALMSLMGLGWFLAASIVGGTLGGVLLDGWLDTKPLFTLLGLFLGLSVALVGGYRLVMRALSTKGPDNRR